MGKRRRTVSNGKRKRTANPESCSAAESKCLVDELPHGLITDILSRLPIKSLFNCKSVCKTWLRLISDPHFSELHLSRSSSSISFLLQNGRCFTEQILVQMDEEKSNREALDLIRFFTNRNLPDIHFEFINSCNGLVCLKKMSEDLYHEMIYVCNPILREYITIPIVEEPRKYRQDFAFGFSSLSNQYKVLQTFHLDKDGTTQCQAEVYTVGTGQWRSIGNAPWGFGDLNINTFLHDSIHWIGSATEDGGIICAFDFGFEQFKRLPGPSFSKKGNRLEKGMPSCLGVLRGCLFMTKGVCFVSEKSEIWVMEEYGVKESWSKKFIVKNLQLDDYVDYEPLFLLSSGKILMLLESHRFVCYDPKLKSFQDTRLSKGMEFIGVTAYKPSFVSLQHIAKGEELKVLRQ